MQRLKRKVFHVPENRYIIIGSEGSKIEKVSSVLSHYPDIEIIDTLDDLTVLVEMTDDEVLEISRAYPGLEIELNESYTLAQ